MLMKSKACCQWEGFEKRRKEMTVLRRIKLHRTVVFIMGMLFADLAMWEK